MRPNISNITHAIVITAVLLGVASLPPLGAAPVTVTSNPLWTDTGVSLTASDTVTIHDASGSWTVHNGVWAATGPEGACVPGYEYDEWITNSCHGQLIGLVAPPGLDPNTFPRLIPQGDPRLFSISTNSITVTESPGRLWLGFNDDWSSGVAGVAGNSGSVVVQVNIDRLELSIQVSSVDVCWSSKTNFTYQLQYRSTLTTNEWINLGTSIPGTGTDTCVTDPVHGSEKRFYRIEAVPIP